MKKFVKALLFLIFFFPIALLLKFLNYFFPIRICAINSFLGGNIDLYPYIIKKRNNYFKKQLHLYYIQSYDLVCSQYELYNRYWLEKLFFELSSFFYTKNRKIFYLYNIYLNFLVKSLRLLKFQDLIFDYGIINKKNWSEEKQSFIDLYESYGAPLVKIKKDKNIINTYFNKKDNTKKKIISICNRDTLFKKKQFPNIDFSYHNYRNFPISDFETGIKNFLKKDFAIIRMGNLSEGDLKISSEFYFDYSNSNDRRHENEINIISNSNFYVGAESGLDKVANFLGVPTVHLNVHHLLNRRFFLNKCIFVPQKILNLDNDKYFTFRELLDENLKIDKKSNLPIGLYTQSQEYVNGNAKVINNSPEEINNAMEEMNFFLKNNFELGSEDKKLQDTFWSLYGKNYPRNTTHIISPSFLKKNINLLQ